MSTNELIDVKNNSIIAFEEEESQDLETLEEAIGILSPTALAQFAKFKRAITLARGMAVIQKILDGPIFDDIKALANSPLGFKTDKEYADKTLRDCAIEAMVRGANLTGKEFNIIAGNCYLTKEYFERAVAEFPNLTDLELEFHTPEVQSNKTALVGCKATWAVSGQRMEVDCTSLHPERRIRVKAHQSDADFLTGKATRKLLARVYARVTGSTIGFFDQDDTDKGEPPRLESPPTFDLSELETKLKLAADLTQVTEIGTPFYQAAKSDAERDAIKELAEAAKDRIRSTRGENSNKKK